MKLKNNNFKILIFLAPNETFTLEKNGTVRNGMLPKNESSFSTLVKKLNKKRATIGAPSYLKKPNSRNFIPFYLITRLRSNALYVGES